MIKLKRLIMDTNKILSANLLDLVFDNRNKEYGAYELRKHYHIRITKALVFTGLFVAIAFTGVVMANKLKPREKSPLFIHGEVTITELKPDEKEPEPLPQPKKPEMPPIQTEQFTQLRIVNEDEVEPMATQVELANAIIDTKSIEGDTPDGTIPLEDIDENKGIIEEKVTKMPDDPIWDVQVHAKYDGNWIRFLERNLNAEVPINNGAPEGSYTVIIQFVVDIDGSISDVNALTNHGYGLEQEAIRVIKKATKWEPAIQNGRQVKAYRKQPITFRVESE